MMQPDILTRLERLALEYPEVAALQERCERLEAANAKLKSAIRIMAATALEMTPDALPAYKSRDDLAYIVGRRASRIHEVAADILIETAADALKAGKP